MSENLSLAERIDLHRRMALAYHGAYQGRDVQDGQTYAEWIFAPEAVYWSPYFGAEEIELATHPVSVQDSATMEALAYGVRFTDWGPASFECWPAEDGFAMKTRFEGHTRDGVLMGFFAYGFVRTDAQGRIVRWETTSAASTTISSTSPSASTAPSGAKPTTTSPHSAALSPKPASACPAPCDPRRVSRLTQLATPGHPPGSRV